MLHTDKLELHKDHPWDVISGNGLALDLATLQSFGLEKSTMASNLIVFQMSFVLEGVNHPPEAEGRLHSLHIMTEFILPSADSYILNPNLLHLAGFTASAEGQLARR